MYLLLNFVHSGVFPSIIIPDRTYNFYFSFKGLQFIISLKTKVDFRNKGVRGNIDPLLISLFVIPGRYCMFPH